MFVCYYLFYCQSISILFYWAGVFFLKVQEKIGRRILIFATNISINKEKFNVVAEFFLYLCFPVSSEPEIADHVLMKKIYQCILILL